MLAIPAPNFSVVNLGCKVNRVESDSIAARLLAQGGLAVEPESADVIIVNSCTVTGEADKKTRKAVRSALRANPQADVIVTGCGVSVDADAYLKIDPRVKAIERAELFSLLEGNPLDAIRLGDEFPTRVNIKVQDGCDHACTYCIVHVARGKACSVPFYDVVEEARAYFMRGVKEIVLTGIDLGSYRWDGRSLGDLVEQLLEEADALCEPGGLPARIRVSSIEPKTIDGHFIKLLETSQGRLCRHLHLPLQSGSSRVLREMARPYDAGFYSDLVEQLYERVPQLSLTTDIICGFPGETDDDFQQTIDLARKCRFSKIHVFPYSRREGTPAAARADQVPAEIRAERARALRELARTLRGEDLARRAGTTELVLLQPDSALTESYHEIALPPNPQTGQLVPVIVGNCSAPGLKRGGHPLSLQVQ